MIQESTSPQELERVSKYSRLVHGLAVVMTITVFPLIWVGGLVTTYGAGMAVPDWPQTYGWNMFLYPPSTWLYGGFDLMVEHGHRLLGSLVGLLAIALLIAALFMDRRRWFHYWCGAVLLAVIGQGILGGMRVRLDERLFAMIHGCTGQLFLAIATATAIMCSPSWIQGDRSLFSANRSAFIAVSRWATMLLIIAYGQVVAGAQVRHVTGGTPPGTFIGLVHIHLTLAALVLLTSVSVAVLTVCHWRKLGGVKWLGISILGIVFMQVCLGVATWVVNYALPWQELLPTLASYIIQSKGYWESVIVTAHVATGALIIHLSTLLCMKAWRCRW